MKRYVILAASLSVLGFASAHAQTFPSLTGDNSAKITQIGDRNTAEIDQAVNGLSLNGQNRAEISQEGNRNNGAITQTSANGFNNRFSNTALIDQTSNRGQASIQQIYDHTGIAPNAGLNEAVIEQNRRDAEASIGQRGDGNTARIFQRANSDSPIASIQQNGVLNRATVFQRLGASGTVTVSQGEFSAENLSPETFSSRVFVDQQGTNADIIVSQIGFSLNADVFENGTNGIIDIKMEGGSNTVDVTQLSNNGFVLITTERGSSGNLVTVTQNASDTGSSATVLQSGSDAIADIEQSGGAGITLGNLAEVTQSGDGIAFGSIEAMIVQNGSENEASVNQASRVAESIVFQTGIGHVATVSQ